MTDLLSNALIAHLCSFLAPKEHAAMDQTSRTVHSASRLHTAWPPTLIVQISLSLANMMKKKKLTVRQQLTLMGKTDAFYNSIVSSGYTLRPTQVVLRYDKHISPRVEAVANFLKFVGTKVTTLRFSPLLPARFLNRGCLHYAPFAALHQIAKVDRDAFLLLTTLEGHCLSYGCDFAANIHQEIGYRGGNPCAWQAEAHGLPRILKQLRRFVLQHPDDAKYIDIWGKLKNIIATLNPANLTELGFPGTTDYRTDHVTLEEVKKLAAAFPKLRSFQLGTALWSGPELRTISVVGDSH